jgi:hypothetical protein
MTDARDVIARYIRDYTFNDGEALTVSDAIIAALTAAGFAIVPKEPTEKMRNAAIDKDNCVYGVTVELIWRAMVEAASDE